MTMHVDKKKSRRQNVTQFVSVDRRNPNDRILDVAMHVFRRILGVRVVGMSAF